MRKDSIFFAGLALMFAIIGCAAEVILFDLLAVFAIVWAWVVYETEEKDND